MEGPILKGAILIGIQPQNSGNDNFFTNAAYVMFLEI